MHPPTTLRRKRKDIFYNQLQQLLQARKEKYITLPMGDMNAKLGNHNSGYQLVMGKHGCIGCMNKNGERFADICADYNLVIAGTVFPHKPIHKAAWMSPDRATENQIDHIYLNRHSLSQMSAWRERQTLGQTTMYNEQLITHQSPSKKENRMKWENLKVKLSVACLLWK